MSSSIPPSDYACALAAAVATLLMTAGQPQETRSASGDGDVLWARSQWTKAIDGDAAAHERKSPHGVNLCGLSKGGQSMRIAAIAIRSTESFPALRSACRQTLQCTALQNHQT